MRPPFVRTLLVIVAVASLQLAAPARITPQALRVRERSLQQARPNLVCALCTLTVSATPVTTSFGLVKGGVVTGSNPIVITTTLNGVSLLGSLNLYAYFSSSTAALMDAATPADNIPSSAVLGQVTTGSPTSYTAFTQSNVVGTAGAGLLLFSTASLLSLGCVPISAVCRTDTLNLEINLAGLPQLPAGTYSGSIILQAQAL